MGLFSNQLANVVEWQEYRDDIIFYKWNNKEIKKGSRLIIRPGQDALFLYNGKVEGVFRDEGSFDIESQIIPFLSTLKGFRFGFNSGLRAEVLFINTKDFIVKWGTKNAVLIPNDTLPGGLPIRAFGTFTCRVADEAVLMEKVAGLKQIFTVEDVKERVLTVLDQLLLKWISKEGKDMFHLQANAAEIASGITTDLDMEMRKIGLAINGFYIENFNYPEEVQNMVNKVAAQGMIGDVDKYTRVAVADGIANGKGSTVSDMAGMAVGINMGKQMVDSMTGNSASTGAPITGGAKFCPACGTPTEGMNFCPNCGKKLN